MFSSSNIKWRVAHSAFARAVFRGQPIISYPRTFRKSLFRVEYTRQYQRITSFRKPRGPYNEAPCHLTRALQTHGTGSSEGVRPRTRCPCDPASAEAWIQGERERSARVTRYIRPSDETRCFHPWLLLASPPSVSSMHHPQGSSEFLVGEIPSECGPGQTEGSATPAAAVPRPDCLGMPSEISLETC
jgi:hypothetical protein